mmetsp:Transcript_27102/g.26157  ORF Transcript_27102/g.26157 Transcript_27102/m.26157 type:complete len:199 (-) Transcript_27102:1308-1904(-)
MENGPKKIKKENEADDKKDLKSDKGRRCRDKIIISKESSFEAVRSFYIFILAAYSTFSSAYYAAFGLPDERYLLFIDAVVEISFAIDIILNFFQEYISDEDFYPVRDLKRISVHYLKGRFIFDFLAVMPWDTVILQDDYARQLSRLIKLLRLPKLFNILGQRFINMQVKNYYEKRLIGVVKDPERMNSNKFDNNKIMA